MDYMDKVREHMGPTYWAACQKHKAKPYREPKQATGPIVRLHIARKGLVRVELPASRSKLHGPLAVHPRLVRADPAFSDDTLDGETFFCSAHHCEWSKGSKWSPYTITHLASGMGFGVSFETLAEANKVADELLALGIDWEPIDADPNSPAAAIELRKVGKALREWGLR